MITRILDIIYNNSKATPLTSQVDALDNIGKDQLNSIRQDAESEPPITKKVHFNLPPHHLDKCSKIWRAEPRAVRMSTARRRWENSKYRRRKRNGPLTKAEVRAMVLDGTIPSGISDTGATSTAGRPQDPFTSLTNLRIRFFTYQQEGQHKLRARQIYITVYANQPERLTLYRH